MYNEIMESINKIDSTIMEAEVNVASAMIDAYTKAAMIMEYCDDTEVETFGIIQECFIVEGGIDNSGEGGKVKILGDKSENIFMRILKVIPRLFLALTKLIKKKWDNRKVKQLERNIDELMKLSDSQKKQIDEFMANQAEHNGQVAKTLNNIIDTNTADRRRVKKLEDKTNMYSVNNKFKTMDEANDKRFKDVNEKIDDEIFQRRADKNMNYDRFDNIENIFNLQRGIIKTCIQFSDIGSLIEDVENFIKGVENITLIRPSTVKHVKLEDMKSWPNLQVFIRGDYMLSERVFEQTLNNFKESIIRTSAQLEGLATRCETIAKRFETELSNYSKGKHKMYKPEQVNAIKTANETLTQLNGIMIKVIDMLNYEMDTVLHITETALTCRTRL